mmetsp:Transcript_11995/g.23102  ORF Transcript_11995/g.23102 Transcript_11995/m.23102 type:complete len:258 (+) Transcript_11995:43-816(+)
MHIGPLPRRQKRPHGIILILVTSSLLGWLWIGPRGLAFNIGAFAMIWLIFRLLEALRKQPQGPPKASERFNVANLGNGKFSLSSEDGALDLFLAAPGPHTRVTTASGVLAGCRFHLLPFHAVASEDGKGTYLEDLPWNESSMQVVSIVVADGPVAGARLTVNGAGRARWFKKRVPGFREEFTLTRMGAKYTITTHGRLLDARALTKSRAWLPNWPAALSMFVQWIVKLRDCISACVSCTWVDTLKRYLDKVRGRATR